MLNIKGLLAVIVVAFLFALPSKANVNVEESNIEFAYAVQVGAYFTIEDARKGWDIFALNYPLLTALVPKVNPVLIDNVTYYRLKAGPLESAEMAKGYCTLLMQDGMKECFVRKYTGFDLFSELQ